jgi:predicted nucleic-acid-binding Zn-ribbon protein
MLGQMLETIPWNAIRRGNKMNHTSECDKCGKDLNFGDKAIGIITGLILEESEGFMADETQWLYILCPQCWNEVKI